MCATWWCAKGSQAVDKVYVDAKLKMMICSVVKVFVAKARSDRNDRQNYQNY